MTKWDKSVAYSLCYLLISLLISCEQTTNPKCYEKYIEKDYDLIKLAYKDLPYINYAPYPLSRDYDKDSSGVVMFHYYGKYYYHPVQLAQWTIMFIDSYSLTGNDEYLRRAKLFANKLVEIATVQKDALFFPYLFDFPLHGMKDQMMIAPWYSCMAQGQALSAFVRLYNFTADEEYLDIADKTFKSLTQLKQNNEIWVSLVDENGYLWLEEYPWEDVPNHTLNGFIFALYGLYEYYWVSENTECKKLLFAGLATIEEYIDDFRNPNDLSYYCLKHKLKYPTYHKVHTTQLDFLYKFTGYEYFKKMHDLFYNDYHESE